MVNQIASCGLIVANAPRPTTVFDEFVALCDWPVVTQPSLRVLAEQIELHRPLCLVIWLDTTIELQSAAKLIAQLRDRGPRPYRIAVANNLDAGVEHIFRAAGVHTYLTTSGNILALVEGALLPFVEPQHAAIPAPHAPAKEVPVAIRGPTEARASPANLHPP